MIVGGQPRFIFGKLFLLGFIAVGMIIGSVFWLTGRIDQLERDSAEDIVRVIVTEKVSQVRGSVADYAHWSFAYELVKRDDGAEIYEHLGSGAYEEGVFHQIAILKADGRLHRFYDGTGTNGDSKTPDLTGLQPFVDKLRQTDPADYAVISGIGQLGGAYGAISVTRFTPDNFAELDGKALPFLVGIRLFTDPELQAIANLTQGSGYAIMPLSGALQDPALELVGPDGQPVAQLVWSPRHLGTVLRTEIMPGILLVCFGIFAICFSAARYFHLQSKALEHAVTVASTDKLTGLLNRSGLEDRLQQPGVGAQIQAGQVAVLYLDLNDFKRLNDEHGHKDGDHALKVTAKRLLESVRPHDVVVRLGGDEFVCVVFDKSPRAAAKTVSDRVLIACNRPIVFNDHQTILSPSLGIAVGQPGMAWETLLGQADEAMYQSKRNGLSTATVFPPHEQQIGYVAKSSTADAA